MRLPWRTIPATSAARRGLPTTAAYGPRTRSMNCASSGARGLTAREIADRLGEEFSRAAVIGKANRLGLAQQKPGFTSTKNGRKKPVPALPAPKPPPQPLPPERTGPPRMRRLQAVRPGRASLPLARGDSGAAGFLLLRRRQGRGRGLLRNPHAGGVCPHSPEGMNHGDQRRCAAARAS